MRALVTRILKRVQSKILALDFSKVAREDARTGISLDFDLLEIKALQGLDLVALGEALDRIAAAVAANNAREVNALLGINVRLVSGIGVQADMFRERNILLIKSLVGNQLNDIRSLLEDQETSGLRVEELRAQIIERFGVSRSKGDLLARDQVLKFNANMTQARQQAAGVDRYVWTTSNDDRVREEHAELDGQTFSWAAPPPVGHPGEDYQCRCIAFPVIEEFDGPEETP